MKTLCARSRRRAFDLLIVSLSLLSWGLAAAQQSATAPANQDEVNQQLMQRLQQLEAEVKQLRAQPAAVPAPPPPEPPPVVEMPAVNEVAPRLKLIVFGDVGFQAYSHIPDSFLFGSFDMFMTARLSDKASVLGEVLFIAQSDNTIQPDVERLLFRYRVNDYLTASIGRMHSSIGYYNTAFNYGEFLETTTDRPFIFAFDDQGGLLPMQEVGINITGKIPSGKMGLNYVFEVGNGRAWGPDAQPAQNNQDGNNSKSVNGGLFMRPEKFSGLQVGFSVRHDYLTLPFPPAVAETIATVHAVYINGKYEILNEAVLVKHVEAGGPVFNTTGGYTQWSRAFGKYRPYFRYQYFNGPSNDPVWNYASANDFQPNSVTSFVGRVNGPALGIRYDFTEHSALKLQYERISQRGLSPVNALNSQVAFTF